MVPTALRPGCLLGPSRAVLRASAAAVLDTHRVQSSAHDVIADAGYVLYPSAPHEHYRVLLKVVADTRDIARDLYSVRQPYPCNLAQGRVGLFGSYGVNSCADAASLRTSLQGGRGRLGFWSCTPLFDQLTNGGQYLFPTPFLVRLPLH